MVSFSRSLTLLQSIHHSLLRLITGWIAAKPNISTLRQAPLPEGLAEGFHANVANLVFIK